MPIISLIAAIDEQGGMGRDNRLLCHLPADLSYFRANTLGKPVIMGRKTFESINQRPLPKRTNIIISSQLSPREGITVVPSLSQALGFVKDEPEIMIIGGAQLFKESLLIADKIYLTVIHHVFEADVFFPPINLADWLAKKCTECPADENNPYAMTFYLYERI